MKRIKPGECYLLAFHALVVDEPREECKWLWDVFPECERRLVHGYPRYCGRGRRFGQRYSHAWLEFGPFVLDVGSFKSDAWRIIAREDYYRVGNIIAMDCVRYSKARATALAIASDGCVFWSDPPADALFATTRGKVRTHGHKKHIKIS